MAEHYLTATMPGRKIQKDPVVFKVWTDGKKAGELRVSQGGLYWSPRSARQGIDLTWKQFAKLVENGA